MYPQHLWELLLDYSSPQAGSGRKKVLVRKFSRDAHSGYAAPSGFVREGRLELLDLSGKVLTVGLNEVKMMCFVREFLPGDDPERLIRRNFSARPRSVGLWLRMRFRDGDEMEGLAANDISLIDPHGIQFTPPDMRSNTQRIFVPRLALQSLEVLALVRASTPRRRESAEQEGLFTG